MKHIGGVILSAVPGGDVRAAVSVGGQRGRGAGGCLRERRKARTSPTGPPPEGALQRWTQQGPPTSPRKVSEQRQQLGSGEEADSLEEGLSKIVSLF